jgi:hypothetical protein
VTEDLQLGLVAQAAFGGLAQPGRGLGPFGDHGQRNQALRPMRAVDQPRRDLAGAVPGTQRRAGHARIDGGLLQRHPLGAVELSRQLKLRLPLVEPVFPVHDPSLDQSATCRPFLLTLLIAWY